MADTSIRSTHSNISRGGRPESGRLHRKYPYRWLFDQVHVKSLIFHVEVALLAAALIGLYKSSQMNGEEHFDPLPVPGFDGLSWIGENYRNYNGVLLRPNYGFARNIINIYSYFLIFSVVTGFMGMLFSETSVARRKFPTQINPAALLVPSSISVITFMYPLFVWTLRTVHSTIRILIKDKLKFSVLIDSCRLSFIPIILIWAIYIYFLYGFWLGVLYYQRRGDHQPSPTSNNSNSPIPPSTSQTITASISGKRSIFSSFFTLFFDAIPYFLRFLIAEIINFQRHFSFFLAGVNLLSEAVTNEISAGSTPTAHCILSIPSSSITPSSSSSSNHHPPSSSVKHNRSVSPRGYRHLETVDEEAQSRSSSSD
ncbi:hypothetical protein CAEBREN_13294 [Caenorhabditis brenneri]|uniref:Uncharacterized protein n=1 Tax=Caenorhabditis brenneri TaxID=135651 RepID=G0MM70_CAEBE|nr:hypothetical protein CAEBREN_13294 [Caenorhabditis brenneri]